MAKFHELCQVIERILIFIVAVFAAVMIIVTTVEVFRRYFLSMSYEWAEELSRYLMVSMAFLGGAVAYRHKNLVPLDLITSHLPQKVQVYLETILEIVSVVILIGLLYFSTKTVTSPVVYLQKSIGLPISMAYPFASMPISFACMLLYATEHLVELFGQIKRGVN